MHSELQRGFTLVEVIFALIVLGGSLVVLLGLQSSLISRTLRDETQEHAILLTRQLLAPLEVGLSPTEPVDVTGTFRDVYGKVVKDGATLPTLSAQDDEFTVTYTIAPWKIAGIDADVMRKVTVTVSWGTQLADKTSTNYFFPIS